jgi:hypothetical protein
MNTTKQLSYIERDLNGIIAAITQVSGRRARRARRVAQIAAGKITGIASIGGMLMFISAFGSASTGTAIGVLSGAAATSAQMYWIGSIFGMGAVAGGIILPVFGAVLGLIAAFFLSRAVFGRPRKPENMHEFEVRALYASARLAEPIISRMTCGNPPTSMDELRVYAHEGLRPLCAHINEYLVAPAHTNKSDKRCQYFDGSLALLPHKKLRRHHRRLSLRAAKLARPKQDTSIRGLLRSLWRSRSNN